MREEITALVVALFMGAVIVLIIGLFLELKHPKSTNAYNCIIICEEGSEVYGLESAKLCATKCLDTAFDEKK